MDEQAGVKVVDRDGNVIERGSTVWDGMGYYAEFIELIYDEDHPDAEPKVSVIQFEHKRTPRALAHFGLHLE